MSASSAQSPLLCSFICVTDMTLWSLTGMLVLDEDLTIEQRREEIVAVVYISLKTLPRTLKDAVA